MRTIDGFDFSNKTVIVRTCLNSPYDEKTKRIELSERLVEGSKTIKELLKKNAKVVIIGHQGKKGEPDFTNTQQHAIYLTKLVGKKIEYIDDIIGEKSINKIKNLKPGEAILLENVRFLDDETVEKRPDEHKNSKIVKNLSPLAEAFVFDAFPDSHRSHASTVGFIPVLPTFIGRYMEKELNSLKRFTELPERPSVLVIGGAKVDEPIDVAENLLRLGKIDKVLTGGLTGELFLAADYYNLGKETMDIINKKCAEYIPRVQDLLRKYRNKIETPIDFAIKFKGKRKEVYLSDLPIDNQLMDIGKETVKKYIRILKKSNSVIIKGPMGVFEEKGFEIGTRKIFKAASNVKFSLLGGGHSTESLKKLHINKNKFTYVSLSGGAFIEYLSGKKLPVIEALENFSNKN
ncbi:MAG: phosphoglycerate kinase [Candidatus Aenigmatarchaeota archaeon]